MMISNDSNRHVAIRIMFSNPHRRFAEDETEIIRPLDNFHTFINCASFGFNQNVIEKHQIIIQWTNVPRGVKEFSHDWFDNKNEVMKKLVARSEAYTSNGMVRFACEEPQCTYADENQRGDGIDGRMTVQVNYNY
ncbi:hypothetical protein L5515_005006 [Caenorhabditis briggsae]|uniref:MSP domain-containing protein n=1 Tax=Caenorhabditis briggsae TaxID=6238 RepID=A0AAE9EN16_CAEBR|nr:hypothetical protein L5515_005006 [Caenorhabditis briggsae]